MLSNVQVLHIYTLLLWCIIQRASRLMRSTRAERRALTHESNWLSEVQRQSLVCLLRDGVAVNLTRGTN